MNSKSYILGLGGSSHDFSAALAVNRDIRVAIEEERLTRRKHGSCWWFDNPVRHSVDYCLNAENTSMEHIAAVVTSDLIPSRVFHAFSDHNLITYPHHLCHAASAVPLLNPDERTAIVVIDGMGSCRRTDEKLEMRETISFYMYISGTLELIGENLGISLEETTDFPRGCTNSLGHLYELATLSLGFGEFQEGKTMGLASFGQPNYTDVFLQSIELGNSFKDCFRCKPVATKLHHQLTDILNDNNWSFECKANIASSVQHVFTESVIHCVDLLKPLCPDTISIVGGCGLNTVANGALAVKLGDKCPLIIPPYTSDSGLAIGAIWLYTNQCNESVSKRDMTFLNESPVPSLSRPGRLYPREEIQRALLSRHPHLAQDSSVFCPSGVAAKLSNGNVVGVFNGRSEIGPRALGGRSILADPRTASIRERLNRGIKKREPFRPFAPLVLEEDFDNFFNEIAAVDPYMLKIATANERCRQMAPAIVHVDGTSRVQCVGQNADPFLLQLLYEFKTKTGLPILLNTSFNRRGEPLVETPGDAIDCFLGVGIDGLYLDGEYYFKPG